MAQTYITPSEEQIQHLRSLNLDGPIVMLNLLKFAADGGRETYQTYGKAAAPFLQQSGADIRYLGEAQATVIGDEDWDEVILVEYPTVKAFLDMTGNPDYPSDIRADGLEDSRLYCTQPR